MGVTVITASADRDTAIYQTACNTAPQYPDTSFRKATCHLIDNTEPPKALAREHTKEAIETLAEVMRDKSDNRARVLAANDLLDRGWGKPERHQKHEADMRQHILSDRPLTVDEWTDKYCRPVAPAAETTDRAR
jgi:hypothetical protein